MVIFSSISPLVGRANKWTRGRLLSILGSTVTEEGGEEDARADVMLKNLQCDAGGKKKMNV